MTTHKTATEIDRNHRRQRIYYAWTSWIFGLAAGFWMIGLTILGYVSENIVLMTISAHGLSGYFIALFFYHEKQSLNFLAKIDANLPDVVREMEQAQVENTSP